MKIPIQLRLSALGNLEAVGEIDLPDELLKSAPSVLTDEALRDRWGVSARTLKRLRDRKRLPYSQPTARVFLYRMADVEALEAETRVAAAPRTRIRAC